MKSNQPGKPNAAGIGPDSAISADDVRAAAAAYHELGPEYSNAVLVAFLEKVDREITARVEARLGHRGHQQQPVFTPRPGNHRGMLTGIAIGLAVSVIPLLWFWDLGTRSPEQNTGRGLIILVCLAPICACVAWSARIRTRRGHLQDRKDRQVAKRLGRARLARSEPTVAGRYRP